MRDKAEVKDALAIVKEAKTKQLEHQDLESMRCWRLTPFHA
jgi:hypothetical protein